MPTTDKYPSLTGFYEGRSLFVTGATGFMGKILVEKLLRSCPDVGCIYLLMRPKRGQQPKTRLDSLLNNPIFDQIRKENPGVFEKLRLVCGDVSEDGLGIEDQEVRQELLEKVSVVFHCAACVRFDMTLRYALTFNTKGTKRVLDLCSKMTKLESFVYVSTSYCHCDRDVLGEEPYDAPFEPEQLFECVDWLQDDMVQLITPKLIGNLPNTYAFSKCLSEKLVTDASKIMPVAIARPSIVTAAFSEPIPGYVDNLNGPTGLLLGAGKGVLRSMHCKPAYKADLIPVDLACNGLIVIAWHLANCRPSEGPLVVNLTTTERNPVSWGEIIEYGRKFIYMYPFSGVVWWPDGSIKNSKLAHEFCVIFFHIIPAYLIDCLAVLFRHKPFMVNIQKRLQGGLDLLQYYTTKEWNFTNRRIVEICDKLEPSERECFTTDVKRVQWDTYVRDMLLGTRRFILKDDISSLPKAKRHMNRLYWLDRAFRIFVYFMIFWMIYSSFSTTSHILSSVFKSSPMLSEVEEPSSDS
ncbi:putative fatty acyl-CoA reductase CG5065 [Neocloeon triangulifer]|uniref:putative fatty acyl-CoA reductase CG5065 n=1 Tax=Neocloeon triangulifer TaxID=2078957 RepID=UPI00286F374B|nr:putative fatty acyl-CoA reductase CG5065 [Neocloeon triangulifer]XP_059482553.1 putative fatty acyl-CoA reductase CG5065 [Neocloeon triangulifer]